jgi:hypothetical protein
MGVLKTISPDWLQTPVLPISASQVARIIGVSHWYLLSVNIFDGHNPAGNGLECSWSLVDRGLWFTKCSTIHKIAPHEKELCSPKMSVEPGIGLTSIILATQEAEIRRIRV